MAKSTSSSGSKYKSIYEIKDLRSIPMQISQPNNQDSSIEIFSQKIAQFKSN